LPRTDRPAAAGTMSDTATHPTGLPPLGRFHEVFTGDDICCKGNGAVGRPLIADLPVREHALVPPTRSPEDARALLELAASKSRQAISDA
jgi:hypothetical protein